MEDTTGVPGCDDSPIEAHTQMDAKLKLFYSILLGYLIGAFYHLKLSQYPDRTHYLYFTATSLCVYYWNYGNDVVHPILCVFVQWILFCMLGGSDNCVAITIVFQMGYYLTGVFTASEERYTMSWLTPQCVLVLRMID